MLRKRALIFIIHYNMAFIICVKVTRVNFRREGIFQRFALTRGSVYNRYQIEVMKNKKFYGLSASILSGFASLIHLENESGNILPAKNNNYPRINRNYNLEYQPDYPYLMTDPRINFIKQALKIVLSHSNMVHDNRFLSPFSFRLKHFKKWLMPTDISTFLNQMAWNCKVNCIFCCQKGNPPFMRIHSRMSKDEIKTRLKYFDPKRNLGLVGGIFYELDEVLNNPHIFDVLRGIRRKEKDEVIIINTNGVSLIPEVINALRKYNPLLLVVSLNSADPAIRNKFMKDPHPGVAISSLLHLKRHRIPFIASIVAWPTLPFSDIVKTMRYAEKNNAYCIAILLPGYSRYFAQSRPFAPRAHWKKVVKYFNALSPKFRAPIFFLPNLYAQNLIHKKVDRPNVIGAIKNSPAYVQGIKPGDVIKEINGQPINSNEEAVCVLTRNIYKTIRLKIARNMKIFELEVKDTPDENYPYCGKRLRQSAPFGFMLAERYFSHDDIKEAGYYISLHQAKKVWVLTSIQARPLIKYLLKKYDFAGKTGAEIRLITPKNRYFGGNINSGNLLVVEDYVMTIKEHLKKAKTDLIIIPASPFTAWGRDLTGRLNLEIERKCNIPIEFIYTKPPLLADEVKKPVKL